MNVLARAALAFGLASLAPTVAGCGAEQVHGSPQKTVQSFLTAFAAKDFARACSVLTPDFRKDLRIEVLSNFRPSGRTLAERHVQVVGISRATRTCPGTLQQWYPHTGRYIARAQARLPTLRVTSLRDPPMTVLGGDATTDPSWLDHADWIVVAGHDHFAITAAGALEHTAV
jgi:hypothetical protein